MNSVEGLSLRVHLWVLWICDHRGTLLESMWKLSALEVCQSVGAVSPTRRRAVFPMNAFPVFPFSVQFYALMEQAYVSDVGVSGEHTRAP